MIVWGNITGSSYVDLSNAKVYRYDSAIWGPPSFSRPLLDMIYDRYSIAIFFMVRSYIPAVFFSSSISACGLSQTYKNLCVSLFASLLLSEVLKGHNQLEIVSS